MKYFGYKLLYLLSIIGSLAFFIIPVFALYNCSLLYMNGKPTLEWYRSMSIVTATILTCCVIIISLIIQAYLSKIKAKARENTEYNEDGTHKKNGSYQKLSKKERAAIDKQLLLDAERILGNDQLRKITHKGSHTPEKDMNSLIGLDTVKLEMKKLTARMMYEKNTKKKQNKKSMHMCFIGPPGTGKTTCARIMTGFLYRNHYIKKNKCIEIDGNFLKQTSNAAARTEMVIRHAFDGVLFIDEAYALLDGSPQGVDAFVTIIKMMEDYRDRFVLILAGYDYEMKLLIESNPGFFSRINYYLWFESYNNLVLGEIFKSMAKEHGLIVSDEGLKNFYKRIAIEKQMQYFGNARAVRKILDQAIDKHAYHLYEHNISDEDKYILQAKDIDIQTKENDFF